MTARIKTKTTTATTTTTMVVVVVVVAVMDAVAIAAGVVGPGDVILVVAVMVVLVVVDVVAVVVEVVDVDEVVHAPQATGHLCEMGTTVLSYGLLHSLTSVATTLHTAGSGLLLQRPVVVVVVVIVDVVVVAVVDVAHASSKSQARAQPSDASTPSVLILLAHRYLALSATQSHFLLEPSDFTNVQLTESVQTTAIGAAVGVPVSLSRRETRGPACLLVTVEVQAVFAHAV